MIFHTDEYMGYFNLIPFGIWETRMQSYAVILFFVLSGYLITFLLLKEKEVYATIDVMKFYIRRILRIWPVYYLALISGLILTYVFAGQQIDHTYLGNTILFYGLFAANLGYLLGFTFPMITILWSIGVEEQFYAVWPHVVKSTKYFFRVIVILLLAFVTIKYITNISSQGSIGLHPNFIFYLFPFDYLLIGACAAWLVKENMKILKVIYHPTVQVFAWSFFLFSVLIKPVQIPLLNSLNGDYHAFIYAIIIMNVSANPRTLLTLKQRLFEFLGRISYGIYAYHLIVLLILSASIKKWFPFMEGTLSNLLVMTLEIILVITIAWLSHFYLERFFLRRKIKYLLIDTKPN